MTDHISSRRYVPCMSKLGLVDVCPGVRWKSSKGPQSRNWHISSQMESLCPIYMHTRASIRFTTQNDGHLCVSWRSTRDVPLTYVGCVKFRSFHHSGGLIVIQLRRMFSLIIVLYRWYNDSLRRIALSFLVLGTHDGLNQRGFKLNREELSDIAMRIVGRANNIWEGGRFQNARHHSGGFMVKSF